MKKSAKIYSKLDYGNAVEMKKAVLEIQMNLLNIIKDISDYKEIRKKEFDHKIKIKKNLKDLKELLKKEIDKAPKATKAKLEKPEQQRTTKIDREYSDIEVQLHDIKEKLSNISE